MTVDLLLVLFLQTKDDLGGDDALVGKLEVQIRIQRERGRVFEQMGSDILAIHRVLHVSPILIDSEGSENVEHTGMHDLAPIGTYADYHFLPRI